MRVSEAIDKLKDEKPERDITIDFGWANSWSSQPNMVHLCKMAGHPKSDVNRDPGHHGLHNQDVYCSVCGYTYHYSSG